MVKIVHFADAHIDIAAHGKRDPRTGFPIRAADFLKALDTIIDTAVESKVDLVIFAGDAYKDRTPVPTYQREWESRIIRLSQANIPSVLLIGNHDLSPSIGRAHALQEFETLQIPNVHVISRPSLLTPADLNDLPVQILALPWISRSNFMAVFESQGVAPGDIYRELEAHVQELIGKWLNQVDSTLPTILTAHMSIQGAKMGAERSVMLGNDIALPPSLVKDERLDYVALGHIHKAQDLNKGQQPPVIYPGSIEKIDFGEANDDKFFVVADIEKGNTKVEWHKLDGRRFIDRSCQLESNKDIFEQIINVLGSKYELEDAIVRLVLEYPRDYEAMIDEQEIRLYAEKAFEFHFIRRPVIEARLRLPDDQTISELTDLELFELYLKSLAVEPEDIEKLKPIARGFMSEYSLQD